MKRQKNFFCGFPKLFFNNFNKTRQFHGVVVSNIIDFIGRDTGRRIRSMRIPLRIRSRCAPCDTGHTLYDIVDIRKIALHLAMVKNRDRFPFQYGFGEKKQSHVWTTPRSVYSKKTKPGAGKSVQIAIRMGHQFIRLFCGSIQTDRMINIVMDRKGHVGIEAIHGAG